MGSRLVITVSCGERRLSFEIADQVMNVLEAPDDLPPDVAAADAVQFMLPKSPGATFTIRADLHTGPRPS